MMYRSAANAQATIECMKSVGLQTISYCRMYEMMDVPAINSHRSKYILTFRIFNIKNSDVRLYLNASMTVRNLSDLHGLHLKILYSDFCTLSAILSI